MTKSTVTKTAEAQPEGETMSPDHFCPDWVVPTGEFITYALQERGVSWVSFGQATGLQDQEMLDIFDSKTPITEEQAEKLGAFFGNSSQYWVNFDRIYRAGPCKDSHAS